MGESISPDTAQLARLNQDFQHTLERLASAPRFSKLTHQTQLLARAQKLLRWPEGIETLYESAPGFDEAGVFLGGDWHDPSILQPALAGGTLRAGGANATLECLSELRLLAIAEARASHANLDAAGARDFLAQVLAANLDLLFPVANELTREEDDDTNERVQNLFAFLLDHLGAGAILTELMDEVERVMLQRPIMVQRAESLLRAAGRALDDVDANAGTAATARHWIQALDGPTEHARAAGMDGYPAALAAMDHDTLAAEADDFGQSMLRTGLVCVQHADLLRHVADAAPDLLAPALALDKVGVASLETFRTLIGDIIRFAIHRETARAIYGLSRMLTTGALFARPVPPGLRRLMVLAIDANVAAEQREASEWQDPPNANVLLLAGTISVLGQPRGVDQGYNPTCQSARAISLWAQNDVGYLLELIAQAARDDELTMHFEGQPIRSSELVSGLAKTLHTELDPVSLLLTPHLDRIYMEMSRRTIGRQGDGHRWVNPELHGWWVQRGFAEIISTATGAITGGDDFIRRFYATYHPAYNGGHDLVYAQPCGVATTDYNGALVGWHAISIQRVALDPRGTWRVYFFNPNRDKGQNWGQGVVTSTHDNGEIEGESSLPFEQFLSRLYVFHFKRREMGDLEAIPAETVTAVRATIAGSWAAKKDWAD